MVDERYVVGVTTAHERFVPDADGEAHYFYDPTWGSDAVSSGASGDAL